MTANARILIVEDSPTQAERLRHLLEAHGYDVERAANGEDALAAVDERRPAVVVTDVVMPGMDGYTLCERIKSDDRLREVPVILVTSLADPQDVIRSLQCGADNFIRKPYDDRYLLSRIETILANRARREGEMPEVGLELDLAGEKHLITAERRQILDFLLSTYEEVAQINQELSVQGERLRVANTELSLTNAELQTRQDELERALRELEEERQRVQELANLNRAVLDATDEGIALVDLAGTVRLGNASFQRMLADLPGVPGERSIFENPDALAPLLADSDRYRAFVASLAADAERQAHFELELREPARHLRLFTAPVRSGSGSLIGRIFVIRDVTRERELDRLKSNLVATVSHELRTPLTSVLGFAELLVSSDWDESARKVYLQTIHSEAKRLRALVDDFLDLQTIEEGRFAVRPEPLDLAEVLRQQVEMFSHHSARHRLALDLPERPLAVLGERDRLAQVVANLLSNAIKYSPAGGAVRVSAAEHNGFVEVAVRDSGLGIPADQQDQIFTKFFRVDSSDTRRIGGTGLGLALCREIVEAHDGEIGFESTVDEGSTFWFRLPSHAGRGDDAHSTPVAARRHRDLEPPGGV